MILIGSGAVNYCLRKNPNLSKLLPKDRRERWNKVKDLDFLISDEEELDSFLNKLSNKYKVIVKPTTSYSYMVVLKDQDKKYVLEFAVINKNTKDIIDIYRKNDRLYHVNSFKEFNENYDIELSSLIDLKCADISLMRAVKRRHLWKQKNWKKHIEDFSDLKKIPTKILLREDRQLLNKLIEKEITESSASIKHPNLNMNTEDFFNKSSSKVIRVFEHDRLHEAIKQGSLPAYLSFLEDENKVKFNKEKFYKYLMGDAGLYELCLLTALEEAYVIALERKIIPGLFGYSTTLLLEEEAFDWALMRLGTNLTSGWYRSFIHSSYEAIIKLKNKQIKDYRMDSYLNRFFKAYESGYLNSGIKEYKNVN